MSTLGNTRVQLSQSFSMGYGSMEHNLRILPGQNLKQNGHTETRFINEDIIADRSIGRENYTQQIIHKTIDKRVGKVLAELNEHHIQSRHPERVRTLDEWIQSKNYTRSGKEIKILHEYVFQIGNRYTGCPYEMETTTDGKPIDIDGNVVKFYDTRKKAKPKNNVYVESKRCKVIKRIYRDFTKKFIKANPRFEVTCAVIHGDEDGGCHLHINGIWFSDTDIDTKIGLGYSTALAQQYAEEEGIKTKNTRKVNALTVWHDDMLAILEGVAAKHGIGKKDMHNTKKHKSIKKFKEEKTEECEMFAEWERELNEWESALQDADDKLTNKDKELSEKDKELSKKNKELEKKQKELNHKQKELDAEQKRLQDEHKRLQELAMQLADKDKALSMDIAKQEWYLLKTKYQKYYKEIHDEYIKTRKNVNKSIDRGDSCML